MAKVAKVVVKQAQGEPEVPAEVLAQSIVRLDEGMKKIMSSGLRLRAIILLVAHSSGVGQTQCRKVIESLCSLRNDYTVR